MATKLEQKHEVYTKEFLRGPKFRQVGRRSVQEAEVRRQWLLIIFLIASILFHFSLLLLFVLLSFFLPKQSLPPQLKPPTTLTLLAKDPTAPKPLSPPPSHPFIPTDPSQDSAPKNATMESDNNSILKSDSQARKTDAALPDVRGDKTRPPELKSTPYVPPTRNPSSFPETKAEEQPKPQTSPQTAQAQPPPKPPEKPPTPKPPLVKPVKPVVQQITPEGLPVLPPLADPTMAPPAPRGEYQPKPKAVKAGSPPPSFAAAKSDIEGSQNELGKTSPEAMQTELGRYKAKVYRAVGSRWYAKLNDALTIQSIPIGTVHIRFTIHSDGTVDWEVVGGTEPNLQMLRSISENAIREAAPYDPFPEAMKKEIGDSYSDDFSFSIY